MRMSGYGVGWLVVFGKVPGLLMMTFFLVMRSSLMLSRVYVSECYYLAEGRDPWYIYWSFFCPQSSYACWSWSDPQNHLLAQIQSSWDRQDRVPLRSWGSPSNRIMKARYSFEPPSIREQIWISALWPPYQMEDLQRRSSKRKTILQKTAEREGRRDESQNLQRRSFCGRKLLE